MNMTETNTSALRLKKQLEYNNFNAEQYVKLLSQQSDGDRDLQEHRQRIQSLADETAQSLKRNVYQNYRQFIETAREISYLEGEMYQLSHILTEQKGIMESVAQTLLHTDRTEAARELQAAFHKEAEEGKVRNLTTLLEKVEGCSNLLETPGRSLRAVGSAYLNSSSAMGKLTSWSFTSGEKGRTLC